MLAESEKGKSTIALWMPESQIPYQSKSRSWKLIIESAGCICAGRFKKITSDTFSKLKIWQWKLLEVKQEKKLSDLLFSLFVICFEIGSCYLVQAGSEHTYIVQTGLNAWKSSCLSLPSAGVIGVHHHTWWMVL